MGQDVVDKVDSVCEKGILAHKWELCLKMGMLK